MIYFLECTCGCRAVKIGTTKMGKAHRRQQRLQTGSPHLLRLLGLIVGDRIYEKALHTKFKRWRIHGEWFGKQVRLEVRRMLRSSKVIEKRPAVLAEPKKHITANRDPLTRPKNLILRSLSARDFPIIRHVGV